ncbi:DNA-binding LacI/PurR family transcriptional regulator [Pseudarthrobacter oxydans]|uniref:DNA-binding LacI/PurR family transcriptional regulator n=1 Tax=Pseudarthrobacter oxydans TaxID=1671 RepID=A0AAW8NFY5_PSEOX|nr:LacI family DNA-binding transcriptional regulator [Pseudarthrobacter oxydans]MDR6794869.1 DNA-binding LacI/PurR family transcriptional regulator [Pseudarthrobacter oxydans]MDR7166257.1 DNA-binding LacI/PurR family transcriptional regulator [Pseudarthrobacter oxydans]
MTSSSSSPQVRRATILDVAAAAGVSRQTVTRAMNDMPGISASTRERVQQLAAELGYSPSRFAKGLVQGARTSLGLAIPDLTNPYFPAFASSVVEEATQRGWNVVVDDFGHGSGSGLDAVARLGPQVDALVGYLGASSTEAQSMMGRRPVVVLDFPSGQAAGLISFDYAYAAQLALERLKSVRCRRIAYLDADLEGPATTRGLAVAAAAADAGLELTLRRSADSASAAREAVRSMLEHDGRIDGLLVFNDLMAAGALKALHDAGRRVPEDCAVIGMDGIPLGELVTPELTTLSLDLRAVGRAAVDLVDHLISGRLQAGSPDSELVLKHQLVLRQSA